MADADLAPDELARAVVLRQLALGPRTRHQLAQALGRKQVPEDVAEAILDRFEEVDLVDDAAFAEQWVTSRHAGRGLARRALGHELRRRGVDEPTVRSALEQVSPDDEHAAATELVERRLARTGAVTRENRDKVVRSLSSLLARKGYGPGLAAAVVRAALERRARALDDGPLDDEPLDDEDGDDLVVADPD